MKITLSKRIGLLAFLLPCALALSTTVHAETNKLVSLATVHKAASTPLWKKSNGMTRAICARK